jgi:hypothetical protein
MREIFAGQGNFNGNIIDIREKIDGAWRKIPQNRRERDTEQALTLAYLNLRLRAASDFFFRFTEGFS